MTTTKAWSMSEQVAAALAYRMMLKRDITGEAYSKAAVNRFLRNDKPSEADMQACLDMGIGAELGVLQHRSKGSIEMKMMNISAARKALGWRMITGYKPMGNIQKALTDTVKATGA